MGWAYLTQEEAQRTIEPNTLTFMTNIFIDIPILLEHGSQIVKGVILGYHLTIESC
jgi:hypothetical protein